MTRTIKAVTSSQASHFSSVRIRKWSKGRPTVLWNGLETLEAYFRHLVCSGFSSSNPGRLWIWRLSFWLKFSEKHSRMNNLRWLISKVQNPTLGIKPQFSIWENLQKSLKYSSWATGAWVSKGNLEITSNSKRHKKTSRSSLISPSYFGSSRCSHWFSRLYLTGASDRPHIRWVRFC